MQGESSLAFLGLAVFSTPLKEGSVPALKMLASSSHQLVMITGDAPLTACFTARLVHIIDRPVLILHCDQPTLAPDGAALLINALLMNTSATAASAAHFAC
jgi:magnesium-transporting ATPase (P-type)